MIRGILIASLVLLLAACATQPSNPPLALKEVSFKDLPGWGGDDLTQVLPALRLSCERILKQQPTAHFGPIEQSGSYGDWHSVCTDFLALQNTSRVALRVFFETRFQPYEALAGSKQEGLFTGYYEASLRGSRVKSGVYRYPIYGRPDDLVMVDLGEFRPELKGQRIAGRVVTGQLKPYETRAAITAGNWPYKDKALLWVDDPVDAFFVQVQGSGVVKMDDGQMVRIGYAGQNGWPDYAIGHELVKRGYLTQDNVSMQSIRAWLGQHPDEAAEIMNTNKSYVFFKELGQEGPMGGEGVPLTPGRSLAIDHSDIPYGVPMWVDIEAPAMQRLMVAQDTGGAIIGPVRGDVFWGYGPEAEASAGSMKSQGRYWLLLPKK